MGRIVIFHDDYTGKEYKWSKTRKVYVEIIRPKKDGNQIDIENDPFGGTQKGDIEKDIEAIKNDPENKERLEGKTIDEIIKIIQEEQQKNIDTRNKLEKSGEFEQKLDSIDREKHFNKKPVDREKVMGKENSLKGLPSTYGTDVRLTVQKIEKYFKPTPEKTYDIEKSYATQDRRFQASQGVFDGKPMAVIAGEKEVEQKVRPKEQIPFVDVYFDRSCSFGKQELNIEKQFISALRKLQSEKLVVLNEFYWGNNISSNAEEVGSRRTNGAVVIEKIKERLELGVRNVLIVTDNDTNRNSSLNSCGEVTVEAAWVQYISGGFHGDYALDPGKGFLNCIKCTENPLTYSKVTIENNIVEE